MTKLKPCPFCGGSNVAYGYYAELSEYIRCADCDVWVEGESKSDSAERWNTRTNAVEWHSVEDGLPPLGEKGESKLYLVTFNADGETFVGADVVVGHRDGGRSFTKTHIVAWAELPEPYQPDGRGENESI